MKELSELLDRVYETDNYKEVVCGKGKKAYLFFSSNGLFFPDEYTVAEKVLIQQDRYEWENIVSDKTILKDCGKIIFLRDVYKSWYVQGINSKIDSADKLGGFLKKKCDGYKVVTVGSSAGGYAAVLFGLMLKAEMVFCFSGQFDLYNHKNVLTTYPRLQRFKNEEERNKYYNLIPLISSNREVPIFYFCPIKSEDDAKQYELVVNKKMLYIFRMDSEIHGNVVKPQNYKHLFGGGRTYLKALSFCLKKSMISMERLYFLTSGRKYHEKQYQFPYEKVPKGTKIAIWGAGAVGRSYYKQLKKKRYCKIVGWVDKNYQKEENEGKVVAPDELKNMDMEYVVIAVKNEKIAGEIRRTIEEMDLKQVQIIVAGVIESN